MVGYGDWVVMVQANHPKGMSMRQLALPLVCWAVASAKGEMPSFPPLSHATYGKRESWPHLGVMRVKELAMSLTNFNTRESGPYTSPGLQDRAGPGCRACNGRLQEPERGRAGS